MRVKQMKIDYELVGKIGATHYCDKTYRLYKVSAMTILVYIDDAWKLCLAGVAALNHIKLIPPKPRTRTEYEKVAESIFDLRDEFERGELHGKIGDAYESISSTQCLAASLAVGMCYRLVEKEIDWRDDVHECLGGTEFHWSTPVAEVINAESDCFLELCRVALRANGEIE